jgi:hypothetical protein
MRTLDHYAHSCDHLTLASRVGWQKVSTRCSVYSYLEGIIYRSRRTTVLTLAGFNGLRRGREANGYTNLSKSYVRMAGSSNLTNGHGPLSSPRDCLARETQHLILLPHTSQVRKPLRGLFDLICTCWRGLGFESFDSYVDPHPGQEVSL